MNPYFNATFFEWFEIAFKRFFALLSMPEGFVLASDEIQAIVLFLFAVNASLLGSFLMLKRLTMMANAISHTMILGIILAYIASSKAGLSQGTEYADLYPSELSLFLFSGTVALITAFLTQILSQHRLIREDASNAIVFTSLFAIGITLVSTLTKNAHAGGELLMGNPDALIESDIYRILWTTCISCITVFIFFRGFSVAIFDSVFGYLSGLKPIGMIALLLILVSMTLVTSFRAVGFVMSLAFFITPPLISRHFSKSMGQLILYSLVVGSCTSIIAVALTRHLLSAYNIAVSTGAFAVALLSLEFFAVISVGAVKSAIRHRLYKEPHLERKEHVCN